MLFKICGLICLLITAMTVSAKNSWNTYGLATDSIPPENNKDSNIIFQRVEVEATYPGGPSAWRSYLEKNLRADLPIDSGAPAGVFPVVVQFIVNKDGSISDIKALTNYGYGMEKEVIRVIRKVTYWTPAMQNGRTVKAYRQQPVTFLVPSDGVDITLKESHMLYAGVDNPVVISVWDKKIKDYTVSISQGSIVKTGDGSYIARVSTPGSAIIQVDELKNGEKKKIGAAMFEVRYKPRTQ